MDGTRRERGLLERDVEIARLNALCRKAAGGEGTVVAVRGPAGIGKTALLDAVRHVGNSAGLLSLTASGAELERELAFGVVRQLFEPPLRHLPDDERAMLLQGASGLARAVVLDPEPLPPRQEAAQAAMHGLYWLAVQLADSHPLLVIVDDAHWADAPSLRWLSYLARRLEGVPLELVLGLRDAEPGTDITLLDQVLPEAHAETLRPRPLSTTAVEHWLARTYRQAPAAEFVDGCWNATGGNPFLLNELTTALRAEGLECDAATANRIDGIAPATIARSVLLRLARLGPDAIAVAESAAVLSTDARLDRVARLSEVPIERAAIIVDELAQAGVMVPGDPVAFAHPVLRAAVYEQVPSTRRGLWHRTAAERLLADGAGAEHASAHLLAAPAAGQPWVVSALRQAASVALARGGPDAAARLLRRAIEEPADDPSAVLLELAVAEGLAQDPAALEHAHQAVVTATGPEQRARAALLEARVLTQVGRVPEALETLAAVEHGADVLDTALVQEIRAEALLISVWTTGGTGLNERLEALGVDALEGDTPIERSLLGLRVMASIMAARPAGPTVELARRLLAREDLARADERIGIPVIHSMTIADAFDDAGPALDVLIRGGRDRGAIASVVFGCLMRADLAFRVGDLSVAELDAREALEIAIEHGLALALLGAVSRVVEVLVETEPGGGALKLLAQHRLDGDTLPPGEPTHLLLHARARARAAAGDARAAEADLRDCGARQTAWGDINPSSIPWRSSLALVLGPTREAEHLVEEELELARSFGAARAVGIALRARALARRGDAAVAGLREAVETLAASPARLERARALVDLGAALRRAGRRKDALEALREGLDGADRCGAHQLATRARAELKAAGARPRRERVSGVEALTASERRVAQMATEGLTNRQIAQALFVTTKTVEMHLGRVYLKLGIRRRHELAGALRQPDAADHRETRPG
jgi:DNA-binding CsgD family transcriptional regulator